jgi:hypothetical protein
MRVDWKSMLLGAGAAVGAMVAAGWLFFAVGPSGPKEQRHRALKLPSGRTVEMTALYFAFGDEHSGRGPVDDGVSVNYVRSSAADTASGKEPSEVFEAIRPLSEALGVTSAEVCAFPTLVRKGRFEIFSYSRDAAGSWTSKRSEMKLSGSE